MSYCPRHYGADMEDPRNLAYCRQIQRERGDECRRSRCMYCEAKEAERDEKGPVLDRPAPVQRGLF